MAGENPHPLMGRKLTAAEAEHYLGGDTMNLVRQQLMLCMLDRLGGSVEIPVAEVDATGRFTMEFQVDPSGDGGRGSFRLTLGRKS